MIEIPYQEEYSIKHLNIFLRVSERSLREWFSKGKLRSYGFKKGNRWFITFESLKDFLECR